jgi:hypothetical protein
MGVGLGRLPRGEDDVGVAVVRGEVAAPESAGGRLSGVRLADASVVPRTALVVEPRFTARDEVLHSLGLEPVAQEMHGAGIGSTGPADPTGATAVAGVWVAGNLTTLQAEVISAAAAGLTTAAAVNGDLIAEDIRAAVAASRARRAA